MWIKPYNGNPTLSLVKNKIINDLVIVVFIANLGLCARHNFQHYLHYFTNLTVFYTLSFFPDFFILLHTLSTFSKYFCHCFQIRTLFTHFIISLNSQISHFFTKYHTFVYVFLLFMHFHKMFTHFLKKSKLSMLFKICLTFSPYHISLNILLCMV